MSYRQLWVRYLVVGLVLAAAGAVGLWWLISRRWTVPPWLLSWLISINVTAFLFYGYDKSVAGSRWTRVPETALHGMSAAGGGVGAYLGMRIFRHKTVKGSFRSFFWFIVVIQFALVGLMLYLLYFR